MEGSQCQEVCLAGYRSGAGCEVNGTGFKVQGTGDRLQVTGYRLQGDNA